MSSLQPDSHPDAKAQTANDLEADGTSLALPAEVSTDPIDDLPGIDDTPYRQLPQGQRLDIAEQRVVLLTRKLEELTCLAKSLAEQVEHLGRLATLGTLSASLAHEFRNVLMPTTNYAALGLNVLDDPEPDLAKVQKALTKCRDAGQRASRLCEAVLQLARPEAEDDEASVNVLDAVERTLSTMGPAPGVAIKADIEANLTVAMSAVHLEHILLNLLVNAVRAIKSGRGSIRVMGREAREIAVITVVDTGCGMTPDVSEKIFDAFFTAEGGSGLGLSLCKRIVERAGGTISVASKVDHGTTFTLEIPIAAAARKAA